jgi:Transcription factor TFIIH complex subunit Tfb5
MAMIKKINNDYGNSIILEDLGDKACLVKEDKLAFLENKVKAVCLHFSIQILA